MDVLTFLFAGIFVLFLPLGQIFRISLGSGLTLVGLDVAVFVTSVVWIFLKIIKKQKPAILFLPIVSFVFIGGISLLVNLFWLKNIDLFISFLYLVRWFCYTCFIWISFDITKKSPQLVKRLLVLGGGVVMVLGLLQYIFYPSLHAWLYKGWDDHFYRVFSTFLDPNFVGAFLVLYFFFIFSLLLQSWQKNLNDLLRVKKEIVFFLALAGFSLIAVFLTYSRSAYLMLSVGVVLFLWNLGYKKWIILAVGLLASSIIFLGIFHRYGEGNNLLRTVSISSRLGSMTTAFTIFTKEPILGTGFNSYRYAQRKYGFLPGNVWETTHAGAGTSNSFLFILATTGIVGCSAYFFFLWKLFARAKQIMKKKKIFGILLFVSLFSLCVNALFENTLFYPSIMLWIFTILGFIADS